MVFHHALGFARKSCAQACVLLGYPMHHEAINTSTHLHVNTVSMDVTFLEDRPFFPVNLLQGESVSEESNCVVLLKSTCPTLVTLPDPSPQSTPAPVQDSEPLQDQGITDFIDMHINNRMSENDKFKTNSTNTLNDSKVGENDKSETAVPEDMVEKGSVN
ncbi:uncharacterized protein E5676_scaffold1251G00440 [Cucumis melo var. makuwa]|uniref:Uncharacterized protein n=1 Tax=Cucumis melo var. makuwa TaxID=1194695 RepID=A0A5A7TZ00_CUCMM|nr:uncharacterized protein E6C27_scaffold543G00480 [Cucumis melo var. makuwa]TYJ97742.1 uncharacterized protein E5676_scaffold1251G00440 [Cucumis melo var. makuwa]